MRVARSIRLPDAERAAPQGGDPRRPRGVRGRHDGSTSAATSRTAARAGRRRPAACCARSTSASPPTTWCSPAARPTSRTGAAAGREAGDLTGPAGRGTVVQVDPVRHVASEGSVTVIDLATREAAERDRHRPPRERPRRLARRPARRLRERGERHPQRDRHAHRTPSSRRSGPSRARPTCSAPRPTPWPSTPPAARSTSPTARRTPWRSSRSTPADRESKLLGLIPVGWFPGALVFDAPRRHASRRQHQGTRRDASRTAREREAPGRRPGFNSHHYHGSLSLVPVPADAASCPR